MTGKIVLVALVALLVTFGCIGGGQTTSPNASAGTPAVASNNNTAATSQNTTTGPSNPPSEETPAAAFESILANIGQPDYKVSYDMVSYFNMSVTEYFKGNNMKYEFKIGTGPGETPAKYQTFILDKTVYSCSKIGSANFSCLEVSGAAAQKLKIPTAKDLESSSRENYTVQQLPDRTIAGMAGKCFNLTAKVASETGIKDNAEYCFSTDAIILYVKTTTSSGISSMTATAIERGVSDSVFALPAAPTTKQ